MPDAGQPRIDLAELRAALLDRCEELAEYLTGEALSRTRSKRGELRFGGSGGFSLITSGSKRGEWFDHRAGKGGGPIEMVAHFRNVAFDEAVEWAATWAGIKPHDHTAKPQPSDDRLRQERERQRRQRDAEQAADEAERLADARRFASEMVPIGGTLAEHYLTEIRRIPRPSDGWPAAIGFHPGERSLIVVASTPDGEVRGVQRVLLTPSGENVRGQDGHKVKRSRGVLSGAAVRLPGPLDGALAIAEGPETGASIWSATGLETWIALGSLAKLELPPSRRIVACRDDDQPHCTADKAFTNALEAWHKGGIDVAVATPWPARRGDSSDFNDLMREGGPAAVRERIDTALNPHGKPSARISVGEARQLLDRDVAEFFSRARSWGARAWDITPNAEPPPADEGSYGAATPDDDGPAAGEPSPPADLVLVDVGAGKSDIARRHAVSFLAELRQGGDQRNLVFAVPTHQLSAEQLLKFEALPEMRQAGLQARIWRGRSAENPDTPGHKMCRNLELIREVQALKLDVDKRACGICQHRESCSYLEQRRQRSEIWLCASTLLFEAKPKAFGNLAAVIVDESPIGSALEGIEHRITLPIEALDQVDKVLNDTSGLATDRLRFLRRLALDVLGQLSDGPLIRTAFEESGLTAAATREARALEWRTRIDVELQPSMKPAERKAALRAAARNADLGRRVMFWRALEHLLGAGVAEASGWAALGAEDDQDGKRIRILALKGRRDITKKWQVPTLLLDATAKPELLRFLWPQLQDAADVRIAAPHMHIRQTTDAAFAEAHRLRPIDRQICRLGHSLTGDNPR